MLKNLSSSQKTTISEWLPVFLGLAVLYIPTYFSLAGTIWASDEQGQGPIILGVALWFFWQKKELIHQAPYQPCTRSGSLLLLLSIGLYVIGRSQGILLFEVGTQITMVAGVLLLLRGVQALKYAWFPLFFLVFMIPLPRAVVDALTLPMKTAVSMSTDYILYSLDYPISRTGVILHIGQYKLLVADACAGLHTLFTLEALGLLYLHLVRHDSLFRNIFLAIAIVPISFSANTIRVCTLALITYHFGDEAGQGFLHGFAGMVLFMSALILIIAMDSLLQFIVNKTQAKAVKDAETKDSIEATQ